MNLRDSEIRVPPYFIVRVCTLILSCTNFIVRICTPLIVCTILSSEWGIYNTAIKPRAESNLFELCRGVAVKGRHRRAKARLKRQRRAVQSVLPFVGFLVSRWKCATITIKNTREGTYYAYFPLRVLFVSGSRCALISANAAFSL